MRDLNVASTKVWITSQYYKLFCDQYQYISIEDFEPFHPHMRATNRLALNIYRFCKSITTTELAEHLQLDWKAVKNIDKWYLESQYGQLDYDGLGILAVDKISMQ